MRTAAVCLSVALAALAGCGNGDTTTVAADATSPPATSAPADPKESAAVEPADGPTLSSGSFEVTLPKGWSSLPSEAPEVLVSGMDPRQEDTASTILVLRTTQGAGLRALTREHSTLGHRSIRTLDEASIAGERAVHVSAINPRKGAPLRYDDFLLSHDGRTYTVRFATSNWMNPSDRTALITSVLMTWTWR